jgi:hypothetical protein
MPSTTILIVEKQGSVKELSLKIFQESDLYKKAGFKSPTDFQKQHTYAFVYDNKPYTIDLYGKLTGKANQENKYDWPPPMDAKLFFGNCILVSKTVKTHEPMNLSMEQWEEFYEYLFGGFEDLDETEEDDEDDDQEQDQPDPAKQTKEGYVKDDFVVDDGEEEEVEDDDDDDDDDAEDEDEAEDDDDETEDDDQEIELLDDDEDEEEEPEEDEDEEEEDVYAKAKRKVVKRVAKLEIKSKRGKPHAKRSKKDDKATESYLDCGAELEEEEYV